MRKDNVNNYTKKEFLSDKVFNFLDSRGFIVSVALFFLINVFAELFSNSSVNLYFSIFVFILIFFSFVVWVLLKKKEYPFPFFFLLVVTLFPDFSYELYTSESKIGSSSYILNKSFSSPISFYIGQVPVFMMFCGLMIYLSIFIFFYKKGKVDSFIVPFILSVIFSTVMGLLNIVTSNALKWLLLDLVNPALILATYILYRYAVVDYVAFILYFFAMLQAKLWTVFFLIAIGRYKSYYSAGVRSMYDTASILFFAVASYSFLLVATGRLKNKLTKFALIMNIILLPFYLLITKGRGQVLIAFITFIILLVIIAIFAKNKQLSRRIVREVLIMLSMIIIIFYLFAGKHFRDIYFDAFRSNINSIITFLSGSQEGFNASISVRFIELKEIIMKFNSFPLYYLFGGGYGSYILLPKYIEVDISSYSLEQIVLGKIYKPHDFINTLLLKGGIYGLFSYLFIPFYILLKEFKKMNLLSSYVLLLLPGLFYSGLWATKISILLGFVLAMYSKYTQEQKRFLGKSKEEI